MSLPERWIAAGKLNHIYANSPAMFDELNVIIERAEKAGLLDDVKFLPDEKKSTILAPESQK